MQKILIFTDSRGEHVPRGSQHRTFPHKLAESADFSADLYLCPFKWTTSIDFIKYFPNEELDKYDAVILYTGIVEWSPRPFRSAKDDVLFNLSEATEITLDELSKDYSTFSNKITNFKGGLWRNFFGADAVESHFRLPYEIAYEGEKTISLYSQEMTEQVARYLAGIEHLIFINSNRILGDWNGDYFKDRPQNMNITHQYCDIFSKYIPSHRLIDLRVWDEESVKLNTCDNIHLSESGSEYVLRECKRKLANLNTPDDKNIEGKVNQPHPIKFGKTEYNAGSTKVSSPVFLILGVMVKSQDDERLQNLFFLLGWIEKFMPQSFKVLVVEQGVKPHLTTSFSTNNSAVAYKFLYNDSSYNRGWGYNVAAKHYTPKGAVLSFLDTDVLLGKGFIDAIILCEQKYVAVSPYKCIYYTNPQERDAIISGFNFDFDKNIDSIKNPVTFSGGILVMRREEFLGVGGFEEYDGYGCEDRALDVTLLNEFGEANLHYVDEVYVHLHHEKDSAAKFNLKKIFRHLNNFYNCTHDPTLGPFEYLHKNCRHVTREITQALGNNRRTRFGNERYYQSAERICNSSIETEYLNKALLPSFRTALANDNLEKALRISEIASELYAESPSLSYAFDPSNINSQQPSKSHIVVSASVTDPEEHTVISGCSPEPETLIVLGNGPSLRHVDFEILKPFDTFALNSAYRFFEELNFFPTYFGCFDNLVTSNHKEAFQSLVDDEQNGIKRFFFIQEFEDPKGRVESVKFNNKILAEWKQRTGVSSSLDDYWIYENSGASAVHAGIAMGYTKIILLGVDCNYVQVIEGASKHNDKDNELVIEKTPELNPNYWRDDYQIKGDVYHVPDAHKFQRPEWERLALNLHSSPIGKQVDVFNCSPTTTLKCFPKSYLGDVLTINDSILINRTTALIKSHGRFDLVSDLVSSINKYYPSLKIAILDDSGESIPEKIARELAGRASISSQYFDIGVSEGRNVLLDQCDTEYFVLLDEDFIFTSATEICKNIRLLATSSLDIIGGSVFDIGVDAAAHNQPRTFHGNLKIDGETLEISETNSDVKFSHENIELCDLVMNFFVAKTDSVKRVKWAPELKLAEHLDFFIRAKEQKLNIHFDGSMQIKHQQNFSESGVKYIQNRARANNYNELFKNMHGIRSIIKDGSPIKG